ncbi:hypothetical protein K449DRAFT_465655 [Hypoxylon sp. EC38]|nr:hypothetical protein K449DRAFT_465655 [Hypoxylon sp. EC38]
MAIIGGEPGGLATAIEFSKLDWKLYENLKPAISEIDTGIMTGIDERLVIQGLDSVLHDNKARRSNENQGHQPRCNVLAQD